MSSETAYNFIQRFFCFGMRLSTHHFHIAYQLYTFITPTKLSAWTCFFAFIAAVLAQSVERVTAEREVAGVPGAGPILRVLK